MTNDEHEQTGTGIVLEAARREKFAWLFCRLFVGSVLLLAAGLKAHQLATVPILGEGILRNRWFNTLIVEFEICFSLWLFFGQLPKLTRLASITLFSVFTAISFYKAISGESSCGCFGNVTVNPWYTMMFDLVIAGILIFSIHKHDKNKYLQEISEFLQKRGFSYLTIYVVSSTILGVVAHYSVSRVSFERLEQVGQVLSGGVVQLEPEKWVGREFPLRDYIVDNRDLMTGCWSVLLVRPGCDKCARAKVLLAEIKKEGRSVALIDVSSRGDRQSDFECMRLTSLILWNADVPVLLELAEGIVKESRRVFPGE